METLKFKTNINCTGCLSKVAPVLDQEKGIEKWEVDLNSEDRMLKVYSSHLNDKDIENIVSEAGYFAKRM